MKNLTIIIFLTAASCIFAQTNTMTFNGTSTTASGVTFSFSTGNLTGSTDGSVMQLYSNHPYVTPVNGGNDYKDITISQVIWITTVNVSWATNVAGFKLQFFNGGTLTKELSSLVTGDAAVNAPANKIRFLDAGVSASGGFELANVKWNPALPVELTSFSADYENNKVTLYWQTASEVNNYGFEIERAIKGSSDFKNIGFVQGSGNSNAPKSYSFSDNSPLNGELWYRLKQVDNDGQFKYYEKISVCAGTPKDFALMQNTPNPFNPSTSINFSLPENTADSIKIYDMMGKEVASLVNGEKEAGSHIVYWNGRDFEGRSVSSGVYLYKLTAGTHSETKKMNLLK